MGTLGEKYKRCLDSYAEILMAPLMRRLVNIMESEDDPEERLP
jgi:hypothetical protein